MFKKKETEYWLYNGRLRVYDEKDKMSRCYGRQLSLVDAMNELLSGYEKSITTLEKEIKVLNRDYYERAFQERVEYLQKTYDCVLINKKNEQYNTRYNDRVISLLKDGKELVLVNFNACHNTEDKFNGLNDKEIETKIKVFIHDNMCSEKKIKNKKEK